jgi:hypothetical protein
MTLQTKQNKTKQMIQQRRPSAGSSNESCMTSANLSPCATRPTLQTYRCPTGWKIDAALDLENCSLDYSIVNTRSPTQLLAALTVFMRILATKNSGC